MGSPAAAEGGGEGRGTGGEWREKGSAIEVDVGVDGTEQEITVQRRRGPERSA